MKTQGPNTFNSEPIMRNCPLPEDVLCARGKRAYMHKGNIWLHRYMQERLSDFENAKSRFDKSMVVRDCIQAVEERGGRFLKENDKGSENWFKADFEDARDKISHALRRFSHEATGRVKRGQESTTKGMSFDSKIASSKVVPDKLVLSLNTTSSKKPVELPTTKTKTPSVVCSLSSLGAHTQTTTSQETTTTTSQNKDGSQTITTTTTTTTISIISRNDFNPISNSTIIE